jgi:hypothetical protein
MTDIRKKVPKDINTETLLYLSFDDLLAAAEDSDSPYYQTLNNSVDFWAKKVHVDFGYPENRYKQLVVGELFPGKKDYFKTFVKVYKKVQNMVPSLEAMQTLGALLLFTEYNRNDEEVYPNIADSTIFFNDKLPYSLKGKTIEYLGKEYPVLDILDVTKLKKVPSDDKFDEMSDKVAGYLNKFFLENGDKRDIIQLRTNIIYRFSDYLITDNTIKKIYPIEGSMNLKGLVENDWGYHSEMELISSSKGVVYETVLEVIFQSANRHKNPGSPFIAYDGFTDGGLPLLTLTFVG